MPVYTLSLHDALPICGVAASAVPAPVGGARMTAHQPPAPHAGVNRFRYRTVGPVALYLGDARQVLAAMPDASVDCLVTSPPRSEEHTSELQSLRHLVCLSTRFPYTTLFRSVALRLLLCPHRWAVPA